MNIAEQFAALLPGVEISEEFVAKLTASIETAVAQRVDEQTKAIEEKAEEYVASIKKEMEEISEKANAYAEYVVNEMTQKVDDYCDFVIEQFVEENRQKLVETEEYCRMNKVLRSIREAFETNYFQLSTEPANRDLSSKLQEQKEAFNQLFDNIDSLRIKLKLIVNMLKKKIEKKPLKI
jgi:vacuolar-type H+-ATPase subunit I/STV1